MKRLFPLVALALVLVSVTACNNENRKKALLPVISGKAGEVIVILNKTDWEGGVGSEIRDLLASECPYLPQKEPLYTLVNVVPVAFTNIFQIHRNILIVNISTQVENPGVVYRHDVWAQPQCVISVNATDSETATQLIVDNSKMILNTLEQAERDRIITNSKRYEERSLPPYVSALVGGSPHFPTGYVLRKSTSNFIWIAYETTYTNQGFFVYKYPATGQGDLTLESILEKRAQFLKENVPGMFENTYMITSEAIVPGLEYVRYKGQEFAEVHGLWEVYNDYMGGPFVSHSFYSQDGKDVIVLEGFVYAPRYDKRHYLRQVESILYSFEWGYPESK